MARETKAPRKPLKFRWGSMDLEFFIIIMCLMTFGLVMMFSASYSWGYYAGDSLVYIRKQLFFTALGIFGMLGISMCDYHFLRKRWVTFGIFGVAFLLLILVLIIGTTINGAQRWLYIGPVIFKPSEVMKFAMIVLFSFIISANYKKMKEFQFGIVPFVVVMGVIALLMLMQPHLSGTVIMCAIGAAMMFVGGAKKKHLLLLALVGVIALAVVVLILIQAKGMSYFVTRFESWLDPNSDPQGDTYQTRQSLITIGSGGLFGLGLGNSRQKFRYFPESHNDFVFSIVCEELGFVGAMVVIILFVLFIMRGFKIATTAKDKFGMMLATGITIQIGLQALLNIAVVTNSIPNTGISLPFFSYGGTALVMQLCEMGIMLNISKQGTVESN